MNSKRKLFSSNVLTLLEGLQKFLHHSKAPKKPAFIKITHSDKENCLDTLETSLGKYFPIIAHFKVQNYLQVSSIYFI